MSSRLRTELLNAGFDTVSAYDRAGQALTDDSDRMIAVARTAPGEHATG